MLDLLTILTYNGVISLTIAVVAAVAWWRNSRQADLQFWVIVSWLAVIGAVATVVSRMAPHETFRSIGGLLYVMRTGVMILGFMAFFDRGVRLRDAFIITLPIYLCLVLAGLFQLPTSAKISLIYLGAGLNLACCAFVVWRGKTGERLASSTVAAVIIAMYALGNLVSVPLPYVFPLGFLGSVPVSTWMAYTSILLVICNLLTFLMIVVLKLERSRDIQRQFAEHDALTGLVNRRMFLTSAAAMVNRPGTLVAIIDLDHFKRVNDTYGHKAGDDALIAFSARVSAVLPKAAIFGRLGGEEFGLCIANLDRDAALALLETVRCAIAGEAVQSEERSFQLTLSCGAVITREPSRSLEAWMREADLGLYAAKAEGRNCVVLRATVDADGEEALSCLPNVAAPRLAGAAGL